MLLAKFLSSLTKRTSFAFQMIKKVEYCRNPNKEHIFIRALRLKFHCLNPLNKNPKKAEVEMDFI